MSAALALRHDRPERRREFAFGADDHKAIARLIYDETGIVLADGKTELVYGRLAKRLRLTGLTSFRDYLALLGRDPAERAEAVDALTTNHTKFFREDHHFDHFMSETWPALARRLDGGGAVRIWSAACSSGEEPYSLAMSILGNDRASGGRIAQQNLRILGTDLSHNIIAAARTARYPAIALEDMPPRLATAWTQRQGDMIELHPAIQSMVSYRELNLLGEWPIKATFDAIFCRNVMIYFDEPTKERLQARLAERLAVGGFLYIGHSERIAASIARTFRCVGRTTYQKVSA